LGTLSVGGVEAVALAALVSACNDDASGLGVEAAVSVVMGADDSTDGGAAGGIDVSAGDAA
jgi:hypothetical protein